MTDTTMLAPDDGLPDLFELHRQHVARQRLAQWRENFTGRLGLTGPADAPWPVHNDGVDWAMALVGGREAWNWWLYGNPGTHKTWNALRAVETAMMAGWGGHAMYVGPRLWRQWTTPPEVDRGKLARMETCDVLVLDDLGALRIGDWDAEFLYLISDARWSAARPTVLVSNESQLRGMLGERIASRFRDGTRITRMDGPDERKAQQ